MGSDKDKDSVLKKVLNSRQLGRYKLISTLTQSIQNLCFKVAVNEAILSRISPALAKALQKFDLNFGQTVGWITDYYQDYNDIDKHLNSWGWELFKNNETANDKKFLLLDYLLKDSLFCLNMITEFIEPLYSTTLYNNTFIGGIYRKTFIWNHLLICIREIFEYADTPDQNKNQFINELAERYKVTQNKIDLNKLKSDFNKCDTFLNSLNDLWKNYSSGGISKVESIYQKASPRSGNFLTSSYLSEVASDRFHQAIEMHTSGKSYKEMMTTLFFLEDDLQNDSNYMNLAVERFLINHDIVQDRMKKLKVYANKETSLLQIDNYVKP